MKKKEKRPCGHLCPVCGSSARPLNGYCDGAEADMRWRIELGRIAHKCYGKHHRFDVDSGTGKALPDYMLRVEYVGALHTVQAGCRIR
jgi:hypothetical protein